MAQYIALVLLVLTSWIILRVRGGKSSLDKLPGPPRTSWLSGNLKEFVARDCWDYRAQNAREYGRVSRLYGLFGAKWVQVWDTDAMQALFVKDQDYYLEPLLTMRILIGPGLFATAGEQHRRQRKMLNPVFSTKHLREMVPMFYKVTHQARDAITKRIQSKGGRTGSTELDMLSWMGRTTLEIVGQVGFGHTFDDFTSDEPDEFASAVKSFFPQMMKSIFIRIFLPVLVNIGTPGFRRRVVELVPLKDVQRMRHISDVLHERSLRIFTEKKAALATGDEALKQGIGEARDIMSILLRANLLASSEDRLPDDELIAQMTTMVIAGMDTTANTLAHILQLLSEHQDIQDKLRAEMLHALETDGDDDMLDFDKLMGLPYLEAVCRESFRVYPSVTTLFREATKDMLLPLSEPIRMLDGSVLSALPIPAGTRLVPNIAACNVDPALWGPDAAEWKPERWLQPLPRTVEEARVPGVYSHMMSFLGGNKACIGFKFAQIELKIVLLILLQRFKFEPTGKPIAWNNAPVQYPTVGKVSEEPALPLKVSLLAS